MANTPSSRPRGPEDSLPPGGFECEAEAGGVRYELLIKYRVGRSPQKVWLVIRHRDTNAKAGDHMTGTFRGLLTLEHLGGRRWLVRDAFTYRTLAGWTITVPAGFITDGASVPRPLWWLYPPFGGDYDEAAVIHDFLYAKAELFEGDDDGHITRGEADAVLLEAMAAKGFRASGRRTIYAGVRAGGWRAWNKHRAAQREEMETL